MATLKFETWDVFTDRTFAGNQLAVIMDGDGLTSEQMQAITREFDYSETSFVLPPEDLAHTARVRIFTPGYEMPFAGHPTVGTAIAIARARGLEGEVTLELNAGLFPVKVDVSRSRFWAQFQNPRSVTETGEAPGADELEEALSLPTGSIDRDKHHPRRIGAGVDYIYAQASLEAVRRASVNAAAFEALRLDDTIGVYLYAKGGEAPDTDYHVRMFAPGAGVVEDAATGSAAAAFPGQIVRSEALGDGVRQWRLEQGVEMGRPSRIDLEFETSGGDVTAVRVGGEAAPVMRGEFTF